MSTAGTGLAGAKLTGPIVARPILRRRPVDGFCGKPEPDFRISGIGRLGNMGAVPTNRVERTEDSIVYGDSPSYRRGESDWHATCL
jgi:hypothetical protein